MSSVAAGVRTAPRASACFVASRFQFKATAADDQVDEAEKGVLGRFEGLAMTGAIEGHWLFGNLAIALDGLTWRSDQLPVLRDHDTRQIVGFTDAVEVTDDGLSVAGVVLDTAAGREVAALLSAGYPWQMSVYVPPSRVVNLQDGDSMTVNGEEVEGPGTVFEKAEVREVTFTALGADPDTHATSSSFADDGECSFEFRAKTMTKKTDQPDTPAIKRAALTLAEFRDAFPAEFSAMTTEAAASAIKAERERVSFIRQHGKHVPAELVDQAINEGWDGAKTLGAFFAHVTERKEARLDAIRAESTAAVGTTPVDEGGDGDSVAEARFTEAGKGAAGTADDAELAGTDQEVEERKWRAEFTANPDLRFEFMTADRYVGFKRHEHVAGRLSQQKR